MSTQRVTFIRTASMGTTGAFCAVYALLALATGQPDPLPFWLPAGIGLLAAALIWVTALVAGPKAADQAFDEGYRADAGQAQRIGFWVAIGLYPVFGVLLWQEWVTWPVAFAAMGTLTAAAYLLSLIWLDLKGRL